MTEYIVDHSYPFSMLEKWLSLAKKSYQKYNLINSNAAMLSTASGKGDLSSRIILIKKIATNGLYFYTNLNSKKSKDIKDNNSVSLLFYWETINKQIRIEGKAYQITNEEADEYFSTRPYLSKIGAWASKQSEEMVCRTELKKRIVKFCIKYKNNVPRPEFWSGFRIIPSYFEFWENVKFRLHKRVIYSKYEDGFKKALLYP